MTFDEIVRDVAKRTNLTSSEAFTRIGERVNQRYKRVQTALGMEISRRKTRDIVVDHSLPEFANLPHITFQGYEKILRITTNPNGTQGSGVIVLKKLTVDEIENVPAFDDRVPRAFADFRMGTDMCEIILDSFLKTGTFTLHVEGYDVADVLADDATPFLPASFHDVLIEGALADEYAKMQIPDQQQFREANFKERLSDMVYFIAKHAYLDIAQGRDKPSQLWYRPWFSRISMWD